MTARLLLVVVLLVLLLLLYAPTQLLRALMHGPHLCPNSCRECASRDLSSTRYFARKRHF
jgi:hypothetical protein